MGRLLSQDALEGVLEYCREATVFFDVKIGYLGAYLNDGLSRWVCAWFRHVPSPPVRLLFIRAVFSLTQV